MSFSEPNGTAATAQASSVTDKSKEETIKESGVAPIPATATKSRWKTVPTEGLNDEPPKFNPYLADSFDHNQDEEQEENADRDDVDEDVDGEAMIEDEDVDGEPMVESSDDQQSPPGAGEEEDDEAMSEDPPHSDEETPDKMKDEDDMFDDNPVSTTITPLNPVEKKPKPKAKEGAVNPQVTGVTLGSGFGFKLSGFGSKSGGSFSTTSGTDDQGRKKRMKAQDMFANDDSD